MVVIRNLTTARFIFDSDGDSHEDGTGWTAYDDFDDLGLLNTINAVMLRAQDPIKKNFWRWAAEHRKQLQDLKLITFNKDSHHFVNRSKMQELLVGAMRQLGAKFDAQAERLLQLEKKVLQLSA